MELANSFDGSLVFVFLSIFGSSFCNFGLYILVLEDKRCTIVIMHKTDRKSVV